MAQKGEYHNHSKRGMREGLIKRESQQTKNLVFEPVPRFNFFIVYNRGGTNLKLIINRYF